MESENHTMSENTDSFATAMERFFMVVARPQTYLNLIYLLLSFPLGIFYFVYLITGFSTGIPLILIWVGIPILVAVVLLSYGLSAFERQMALHMLKIEVPPMSRGETPVGLWPKLKALLTNPVTWKGIFYQFLKFPLGIVSFVLVVTLLSVSVGLILAPAAYGRPEVSYDLGFTEVHTATEAAIAAVIGVFLLFGSLHALNGMAWVHGQLARLLLGQGQAARVKDEAAQVGTGAPAMQ